MTYEEFLQTWVSTLRDSGLQMFSLGHGTETLDPRSMARSYECFVQPVGGQETEPFFVTAAFSWRWDALLTARTFFREEDVLTQMLGRSRGSKASTERPVVRLDVSLRASLPYGKPVPMPSPESWAKWAREVHTRLEKIEPLMPKRTTRGKRERPEILAWLTEPVAKMTCDPDGFLELERVEVSAGQIIDIPRNWDDTSKKPDKHPAEPLDAMFKRVRASLHAWMQALDHLLPEEGAEAVKTRVDRAKLRAAIRKLGDEYVYYMLDGALELLPDAKLVKLVGQYMDIKALRPDGAKKGDLFAEVGEFEAASLTRKYFESFNVDSKNYTQLSNGTRAWIAEYERLLERLITAATKSDPAKVVQAFETMFGLLRELDRGTEIVFFADEGGSWLVGVDWRQVFPAYFGCLARTTEPVEYARRVIAVVDEFEKYDRSKHLAVARKLASSAQRKALRA